MLIKLALRRQPVPVAGEQYAFADVVRVGEDHCQPVEAQAPAAVRRHTVAERCQIVLELCWVQLLLAQPPSELYLYI